MSTLQWAYVVQEGIGGIFEYGVTFRDHQQAADYFQLTDYFDKGVVWVNVKTGVVTISRQAPTDRDGHYHEIAELGRLDIDQIFTGVKRLLAVHHYHGAVELHDAMIRGEVLRSGEM